MVNDWITNIIPVLGILCLIVGFMFSRPYPILGGIVLVGMWLVFR
jgi:hypothetical protein